METKELIQALHLDAEWAHANEWEIPITLGDHLYAAADRLAAYEYLGTVEELDDCNSFYLRFRALPGIVKGIHRDRLETICAAEKDGQLYTVHDVAVILASAIGDDCACNINSNDEWLPQLCELQEACPYPVGVACWEQYLKHRAEAEKALEEQK